MQESPTQYVHTVRIYGISISRSDSGGFHRRGGFIAAHIDAQDDYADMEGEDEEGDATPAG
jgi:hypothetical protein